MTNQRLRVVIQDLRLTKELDERRNIGCWRIVTTLNVSVSLECSQKVLLTSFPLSSCPVLE